MLLINKLTKKKVFVDFLILFVINATIYYAIQTLQLLLIISMILEACRIIRLT